MAARKPRYPLNAFTSPGDLRPEDWALHERIGAPDRTPSAPAGRSVRGIVRLAPVVALLLVVWQVGVIHTDRAEAKLWAACRTAYETGSPRAVALLNEFLAVHPASERAVDARRSLETLAALGMNMPTAASTDAASPMAASALGSRRAPGGRAQGAASHGSEAWLAPCEGRVTAAYGVDSHPVTARVRFHEGVDFQASNALVAASRSGVVVHAGSDEEYPGYGRFVVIDHGGDDLSLYANASHLLVEVGDRVTQGVEIAVGGPVAGSADRRCHFEILYGAEGGWRQAQRLDPAPFLGIE